MAGDVSSCDFKNDKSKITEGDRGAAKAPSVYPAGVVPVLAGASALTAGCPPPSAIRCRRHPVPLYFKAITFHGSFAFVQSQPIGFMEALSEFTSQARRRIAVRRHLEECLGGLSVKWGGPPPQQAPVCCSCVSRGGKIKASSFHVELMVYTETPLPSIPVDVG